MTGKPHVAIVGGGVIGISTAIALLGHPLSPYDVTIIAPDLPSLDHKSYRPHPVEGEAALASYASAWAGAHHVSDAKTPKQLKRDRITFDVLVKLEQAWAKQPWAQSEKRPLVYVHQTEYWSKEAELNESAVNWYPQVRAGTACRCTLSWVAKDVGLTESDLLTVYKASCHGYAGQG